MKTDVVVLGAGGDGQVIAEAVRQCEHAGIAVRFAGFLDDSLPGQTVQGEQVFGTLDDWKDVPAEVRFIPAIQKAGDMPRRAARLESLDIPLGRFATVIHPSAVIASDCNVGAGVYIAACATVQPGCRIGDFSSLRAGAAMGHHSEMASHCYLGPNATLCGGSRLETGAHMGPNAVLLDGLIIGRFSMAGVGTIVTRPVAELCKVMGNPARRIGKIR